MPTLPANGILIATAVAAVLAALAFLWALWWLWWRLPKQQVARLSLKIRDPKARADVEDNFRKTIGQALGGAAVLLGAGLAYLQFTQQQQTARDLLTSQQVAKGFEQLGQLGSDKMILRLGGIYALEGVMNGSSQYHQPVLEALCAFVREGTKADEGEGPPATDIQAVLTVIARRGIGMGAIDLMFAHIPKSNLFRANLTNANLFRANLTGAFLPGANLADANLSGANLSGAFLTHANLTGVNLGRTNLTGADLTNADLTNARLKSANLTGADLSNADLTGADLTEANLTRANLISFAISPTSYGGFTVALISQAQLDRACGADAKLPPRLTLKPCPPDWRQPGKPE